MTLSDLKKEKVAVLGLSVEGTATAEFLYAHGIPFTVLEKKVEKELGQGFEHIKKWGAFPVIPFDERNRGYQRIQNQGK